MAKPVKSEAPKPVKSEAPPADGPAPAATDRPTPQPLPAGLEPKTMPTPSAKAAPVVRNACRWAWLRKGARVLTTEARNTEGREKATIRMIEGFQYPMPVGVQIGRPDKGHPMVVFGPVQVGFPALTLASLSIEHWKTARAGGMNVLARAEKEIRESGGETGWLSARRKGWAGIMAAYNAQLEAAGKPAVSTAIPSPELPVGVVAIPSQSRSQDRLACRACGEQTAAEEDLMAHGPRCPVLRQRELDPHLASEVREQVARSLQLTGREMIANLE